ncbi:MAG: branched-chain amino acid ABC transporter substrate-binding protein [Candidatus Electrothrix sp. GW3-4]|uniref:branched-chain amino acid ABC transporter substrate-binding protein n=1 Tax=Candidatus Electrothrix sp. GW3-4 TaxID=3126740 RepID=UPI0030D05E8B
MFSTRKKIYLLLPFLCILLLSLSCCKKAEQSSPYCLDTLGCVHIKPGAPLRIGVLQALSGKIAPLGKAQIRGFTLALNARNGTILGHPVELQIEDTGCTAEGGANAALKIIANPLIPAVFGTTCSASAATASKAMSAAGLVMISGNNSAPFLTSIGGHPAPCWQPGYFRTAPNEEKAGRAAAIYAYTRLGLRTAATINDNDIYTIGLTDGFRKAFEELGGKVVLNTSINKGETQMLPVLTAVMHSRAELLFFPLFQPEGNHLLIQARQLPELANTVLISGGALIDETFLNNVGESALSMYFVGPEKPTGEEVDRITTLYMEEYNEAPSVSYFLSAYDAASLLFYALERSARTDKKNILHIGRQTLRDTLSSITSFKGVTGELTCNRFGDCATPHFNILRFDDPTQGVKGLEHNVLFTYPPKE